ncbi:fluoride efflux transporter CrcB [Amycolatopsis sp. NPDC004368]
MPEPADSPDAAAAPRRSRAVVRENAPVLAVVGLGGGAGALARYGLAVLVPAQPGHFPWSTFLINVSGCFLIGVLMVAVTEVWRARRLVRPFLGVGILGGYTTFSTYAVEIRGLLASGAVEVAFFYLAGTLVAALLAVAAGMWLARRVFVRPERTVES